MIAVDTSALIALLWSEPEADALQSRLEAAGAGVMSAGNALELQLVIAGGRGAPDWRDAEGILSLYKIDIRPFDAVQLTLARDAVLRYGRARHPARLNYGDCFAYALAKSEGLPLLYVGDDFAKTDIAAA